MHPHPTAQPTLALVNYGADYALLRPEPEDARYVLTDEGRAALAEVRQAEALKLIRPFGQGPTVAQVAAKQSTCAACGQPQSAPDCAQREHWGVD